MDKIVETKNEQYTNPDAWQRDVWIESHAKQITPNSRVLDAGAGSSKYAKYFNHCNYLTQDFCQYEGDLVKYLKPIDYVCDLVNIPVEDSYFDTIICTEVFEHIVDPMAALAEFSRILKPGGKLLLTVPAASQPHMEPYHYYAGLTVHWYNHWMPLKGFHINQIERTGGPGRSFYLAGWKWSDAWRNFEHKQNAYIRFFSFGLRMAFRPLIRNILPSYCEWLDKKLDNKIAACGFMVSATKQ